MMEKSKESELPERRRGGKGSGIREADSDDRWFPLRLLNFNFFIFLLYKMGVLNVQRCKELKYLLPLE